MPKFSRQFLIITLVAMLGACVAPSRPAPPGTSSRSLPAPNTSSPAARAHPTNPAPPSQGFIPPQIMNAPGLERVIGQNSAQLERQFGRARLNIAEGDARKLQFSGEACVLDIFLYPLRPGAQPVATHVEARRASDGRAVDRAACVSALSR